MKIENLPSNIYKALLANDVVCLELHMCKCPSGPMAIVVDFVAKAQGAASRESARNSLRSEVLAWAESAYADECRSLKAHAGVTVYYRISQKTACYKHYVTEFGDDTSTSVTMGEARFEVV